MIPSANVFPVLSPPVGKGAIKVPHGAFLFPSPLPGIGADPGPIPYI